MKNVICIVISVVIFGVILYAEYGKTVVRNERFIEEVKKGELNTAPPSD